jgi:hypothetical protein
MERPAPLAEMLTSAAKRRGIDQMHAHLERRSGRPRTRHDATMAFGRLLGVYATVIRWKAAADREDAEARAASAPAEVPADVPEPRERRRRPAARPAPLETK